MAQRACAAAGTRLAALIADQRAGAGSSRRVGAGVDVLIGAIGHRDCVDRCAARFQCDGLGGAAIALQASGVEVKSRTGNGTRIGNIILAAGRREIATGVIRQVVAAVADRALTIAAARSGQNCAVQRRQSLRNCKSRRPLLRYCW